VVCLQSRFDITLALQPRSNTLPMTMTMSLRDIDLRFFPCRRPQATVSFANPAGMYRLVILPTHREQTHKVFLNLRLGGGAYVCTVVDVLGVTQLRATSAWACGTLAIRSYARRSIKRSFNCHELPHKKGSYAAML